MKVSVVIPTYNRKHTLTRAIESILTQTIKPLEIIIVDDGSDDGTREWIKEEYPFIQYLNQNNSGVSASRNRGIFSANGNWIAFLDSDDEWIPEKLERQLSILRSDKEAVFCHTNEIWIRNGTRVNQMKKHEKYGGYIFEKCLDMCRISPSSSIIKKEVFDHIGYFDESLIVCEDYDLWLRALHYYKIENMGQTLLNYRQHSNKMGSVMDLQTILGATYARELYFKRLNLKIKSEKIKFNRLVKMKDVINIGVKKHKIFIHLMNIIQKNKFKGFGYLKMLELIMTK